MTTAKLFLAIKHAATFVL